jgi:DNA-binding Lrp family transcriptional regulator
MSSDKAYILIRTEPNKTKETYLALRQQIGITDVEVISGPYDLITVVEAATADDILDYVVDKIRYTRGVRETITCFVVEYDET